MIQMDTKPRVSDFWPQTYKHLLVHHESSSSSKHMLKGENFIQFGVSFIGNKMIQPHSVLFLESTCK